MLCLHDYKVIKTFMDEKVKGKLFVKEIQICAKCKDKRSFTYSQTFTEQGELDNVETNTNGND